MGFPFLKRKLLAYIILSITLFVIIILFIIPQLKNKGITPTPEHLRLGISRSFLSIPIYIAKNQKYFEKEGLDVKINEYNCGKSAMIGMFNGENDISTVADMPIIQNSFERNDFYILATFAYSYRMVKIVTRKDTGIKTARDLIGKKVGINPGTSSHFYLAIFLLCNLIPISDLKLINMNINDMPIALLNKTIDAASVWEPYAHKAIKMLKNNAVVLKAPDIYRTTFNFVCKKKYINGHQETTVKFLKAINDANNLIRNNRKISVDIIADYFGLNKNTIDKVLNKFVFGLSLDESLLISWDAISRWEIKNKLVPNKSIPNYLNYIYMDTLKKIQPNAITIIY